MIPIYQNLIEKEPQLSEVRMGLDALYSKLERKEEALEVYQQALMLEPNSNMIKMNMANTLGALQRFEEGLAIVEEALEKVPTDISLQSTYLKMLMDTKQTDLAIEKGEKWVEENPGNDLKALLGIAFFRKKEFKKAKALLDESISDGVPREYVYESLGNILRFKGKINEAIKIGKSVGGELLKLAGSEFKKK